MTAYHPDPEPLDIANLTQGTQDALACPRSAVADAGGTLTVTSGYRSQSYQDHLLEVWDKYQIVKDRPGGRDGGWVIGRVRPDPIREDRAGVGGSVWARIQNRRGSSNRCSWRSWQDWAGHGGGRMDSLWRLIWP